ncbi:Nodulation protein N [Maricaulis sp. W15]|uniref:Acyl dehydratase n=1 Tax=Maricaulis maris TaxID=74318 RepID=A0A495DJB9_9PROT|nr:MULTISPECIES: MaoC family dehydratase [Maricaulis]OLF77885.1 Nodulation protein N [Maricaulis sp. W15]RKR02713.1 acyl dehydratase [Maricaulis maris]
MPAIKTSDLAAKVGTEIGVSDWTEITQDQINTFADVTDDHQFIHIDPEKAAQTPFGGTIAHGFLTLSMLSSLAGGTALVLDGIVMGINYGFEKVRFLTPVRSGKKIRGRFTLAEAVERNPGQWMLKYDVTVEIDGEDKPALMAQWLTLQIVG